MNLSDVLIKPLVTEKSTLLREKNTYSFVVRRNANKIQIRQAIKAVFGVNVVGCRVMVVKPKKKSLRNRPGSGKTAFVKKAMVTVKSGQNISELDS